MAESSFSLNLSIELMLNVIELKESAALVSANLPFHVEVLFFLRYGIIIDCLCMFHAIVPLFSFFKIQVGEHQQPAEEVV